MDDAAIVKAIEELDTSDRSDILESIVRICAFFAITPQITQFMTDQTKLENFDRCIEIGSIAMTLLFYLGDKHGFDIGRTVDLVKLAIADALAPVEESLK